MSSAQGNHYAPQSQDEEQNMLDLAMALSMCEDGNVSRPNSRPPSPTGVPDPQPSPLSPVARPSASGIGAPPAPMHPSLAPSSPATSPTPSAPPIPTLPPQPTGRTVRVPKLHIMHLKLLAELLYRISEGSPGVSPQQRYTARTSSGKTRTCNKCNKPFTTQGWPTGHPQQARLYVTVVEVSGQLYHPECVRCKACGKPITAMHVRHKDGLYHEKCHKKKFGITCNCCHERIEGEGPRVHFMHNRFWHERYCTHHEQDSSVSCTGCARLRRPESDDIADIGDGRVICLECLHTIVPDTAAAQPLYNEIVEFYRTNLSMQIPEVPPLMLVENSGLNEACDREGRAGAVDGVQQGPATHTRGLCLIERVSSVRTGRIARDGSSGALTSKSEMVPLQVDRNTVVVAILVLAGLPRVVTGAVIAHELMHAWLREHGIRKLSEQVEEGLCQLMSYLWLESQQLEDDVMQARLASYVGYQIRTHPSEVYGKGFVLALEAYQRLGLKKLLDHVRQMRLFPSEK